jgi:phosphoenolpyruvate carboxykinase (ATP)
MRQVHKQLSAARLIEETIKRGKGKFSHAGALLVETGKKTGRSANDKYVVSSAWTDENVDWQNNVNRMTAKTFDELENFFLSELEKQDEFQMNNSVGADTRYWMSVRLRTPSASHALFFENMFRDMLPGKAPMGEWEVLHLPWTELDAKKFDLKSPTAIAISFEKKRVLVGGTAYAGEIKKSIFSVMNTVLPAQGILPMHSGANLSESGKASVFFGLSGTGKTTLSTDTGMKLIGDDEHGLSPNGIFNFEGGCYAKTYKLSHETEPDIFKACESFGAMLENVKYDEATRKIDYNDKSITENGRASYPLTLIQDYVKESTGPIPKHMFFLSSDAFGVLPPAALLDKEQAIKYFLRGYTAKLAGTEIGVVEPVAAFSTCFGAPFMMLKPQVYADLLRKYLDMFPIEVWLINTGWTGGSYGTGQRFPLRVTRQVIRSIQQEQIDLSEMIHDEHFGFKIPRQVEGVEEKFLRPWQNWQDSKAYDQTAKKLKQLFDENDKKMGLN